MSTQLFTELVQAAMVRDCHRLFTVRGMLDESAKAPILKLAALADQIHEIGIDFIDETDRIAWSHNPRSRQLQTICPHCGSNYCPRAVLVQPLQLTFCL